MKKFNIFSYINLFKKRQEVNIDKEEFVNFVATIRKQNDSRNKVGERPTAGSSRDINTLTKPQPCSPIPAHNKVH